MALNQNLPNAQAPFVNPKTGVITKAWLNFLATLTSAVLSNIYPVGTIYTSVNATSPAASLGFGTWVPYGAGQALVGYLAGDPDFGTDGQTGGEKTHVLTTPELPAHSHIVDGDLVASPGAGVGIRWLQIAGGGANNVTTRGAGSDGAHNNLQPYIVVRFWLRTA